MSENNMNYNEQQVRKSGNGVVKAALIIIAVGIILFIVGVIMCKNTDTSKYYNFKDYSNGFDGSLAESIDLDIGWGEVIIEKSNDGDIHVDAKDVPEDFSAAIVGDTFKIKYNEKTMKVDSVLKLINGDNKVEPRIKITLPEKDYNKFLLDVGAGDANVSGVSCSSFTLDCGAGDVDISDIISADRIDINGGAGDINVRNTSAGGLDIDIGAGDFDFSGTVNGNIDADCGVGNITFRLTNPAEDFADGGKYVLSCDKGIGDIDISYNVK